jgi:hypothetical protein
MLYGTEKQNFDAPESDTIQYIIRAISCSRMYLLHGLPFLLLGLQYSLEVRASMALHSNSQTTTSFAGIHVEIESPSPRKALSTVQHGNIRRIHRRNACPSKSHPAKPGPPKADPFKDPYNNADLLGMTSGNGRGGHRQFGSGYKGKGPTIPIMKTY